MTCSIDSDDDDKYNIYAPSRIPVTPLEIKEKLQGRDVQKLEASHSLLSIIKMILSRCAIREDNHIIRLVVPKIPPSLQGRNIQQLDSSHNLFNRSISIPIIQKESTHSHFYKRDILDLTCEISRLEEQEYPESDWMLSQRQRYIEPGRNREGLTMEERLSQNGMAFDFHRGQFLECRSWLKKMGHSLEKNLRKGAKKTCKFVKEHKTEILIAAGALIVGGCISAGVYYLVGSEIAKDAAAATIIATTAPFKDSPRRRRENNEISSSSSSSDPETDPPSPSAQPHVYIPPLRIHENMSSKQIFDALTTPTSQHSHLDMYKFPASAPQPAEQSILPMQLPPGNIESAIKQLFDKLFKNPTSDLHASIYQDDVINQHKMKEPGQMILLQAISATSTQTPQSAATPELKLTPQSIPFKSKFAIYLDTRYAKTIPAHQEMNQRSKIALDVTIQDISKDTNIFETLRSDLNDIKEKIINLDLREISLAIAPLKQALESFADHNKEKILGIYPALIPENIDKCRSFTNSLTIEEMQIKSSMIMNFLNTLGCDCHKSVINGIPFGREHEISSLPIEKSRSYTISGIDRDGMLITYINGMNNTFEFAVSNAQHIQSLFPIQMSIHGIYNNTNGALLDLAEISALNYLGYSPLTEDLLKAEWTTFHEKNTHNPHAKILHFCHSQGGHTQRML